MAHSDAVAAVVVVGGEADEGGRLFAGDAADLRHADQDGDSGFEPDALDADDQFEPFGEIGVVADGRDQGLELRPEGGLAAGDLTGPPVADTLIRAGRSEEHTSELQSRG